MSLHDEIQALMGELGKKVPAEMMDKVGAFISRLANDDVTRNARKGGDLAPTFALQSASGHTVALADLFAKGPVVVSFYRGEWCPFCDLELRAYQKALPEFKARGATLVAISPQSSSKTRETAEGRSLGFEVLSDRGNAVAKAYGIAFSMNAAEQELHKAFGADLPTINAAADWDIPVPATFVVDRSGRIAWAHVDPNYTARAEPADVVRALDALQPAH
jgi:peroxiredoxin